MSRFENVTQAVGALTYTAQTVRITEQGQYTDRYTEAVERLGSDKLDVRLGAIYALERLARDSAIDRSVITGVCRLTPESDCRRRAASNAGLEMLRSSPVWHHSSR